MSGPSMFRRHWQPPGRFADRPADRRVTFPELFFDLTHRSTYATLALGACLAARRLAQFAVRFSSVKHRRMDRLPRGRLVRGRTAVAVLLLVLPVIVIRPAAADPGDLDLSFSRDGMATRSFGTGLTWGDDVAIQADGRILVVGSDGIDDVQFALARYRTNGVLDDSFGRDGLVRTSFQAGDAAAYGVAVQPNGRIVVAGAAGGSFAVARYRTGGGLDRSFGVDGRVTTSFGNEEAGAAAVVVQPDGRIVVAGTAGRGFALAQYDPDGSLDRSFGREGKVRTDIGASAYIAEITLDVDGRIVTAGRSGYGWFALARYRTDGSLDPSFGRRGVVRTSFGAPDATIRASAEGVTIQSDGRIVAAGWAGTNLVRFALARYRTDGTLDRSFSGDGKVRTNVGAGAESIHDVTTQEDGLIVAAGMAEYYHRFAVARYLGDGRLDATFGGDGSVITEFPRGDAWANAVAMQDDGRIVLAGTLGDVQGNGIAPGNLAVARYLAD